MRQVVDDDNNDDYYAIIYIANGVADKNNAKLNAQTTTPLDRHVPTTLSKVSTVPTHYLTPRCPVALSLSLLFHVDAVLIVPAVPLFYGSTVLQYNGLSPLHRQTETSPRT